MCESERIIKCIYILIRNGYYCIICNAIHGVSIHIRITKYNAKLSARGALQKNVAPSINIEEKERDERARERKRGRELQRLDGQMYKERDGANGRENSGTFSLSLCFFENSKDQKFTFLFGCVKDFLDEYTCFRQEYRDRAKELVCDACFVFFFILFYYYFFFLKKESFSRRTLIPI